MSRPQQRRNVEDAAAEAKQAEEAAKVDEAKAEATEAQTTEETVAENPEQTTEETLTDDRGARIAALAAGDTTEESIVHTKVTQQFTGEPIKTSGNIKAGVLFDQYRLYNGESYITARKGQIVLAKKEDVERGVKLGGLVKIDD